jgi:hypothetical protein
VPPSCVSGPPILDAQGVSLTEGFNFVGWSGPDLTPIVEAVAGLGDAVEAVFLWDSITQLLTFRTALPVALNTLTALPYAGAVWVLVSEDVEWSQPAWAPPLAVAE